MSHGHSHGGGSCCHGDDPEEPPERRGQAWGLYLRIDRERLECLNERREGSGKLVFRAWEDRGDRLQFVESDDDEELLFNIPFTGNVKLKGIIVMGEDGDTHPSEMRLFKNIPHMSFDDTAREPDQTFSLNHDVTGELEYPTKILLPELLCVSNSTAWLCACYDTAEVQLLENLKECEIPQNVAWQDSLKMYNGFIAHLSCWNLRIARFSSVHHLSIHFSKNFGAETTKIFYIGLRGEWTEPHRHEVTICNYEAAANPADHKIDQITPQTHFIS